MLALLLGGTEAVILGYFSQGSLSMALMDSFTKVTSLIGLSDPQSLSDFPLGVGGSRY